MALSGNTVWEVRTAGTDTNGGAFVIGASGTDYSQQDAKNTAGSNISTADAVANGTTTITSATASFTSAIVGNIVYFQGGTGAIAAVWRQVTVFTNSTTITIDATIASSTGMTMNIGGALASLGIVGVSIVSGNIVYIKAGTYTISSATPNVSGGCYDSTGFTILEGYQTTRGDRGTPPLFQASGISTFTIITNEDLASATINLRVDGAGLTSSRGMVVATIGYKLIAENCTNSGILEATTAIFVNCVATGCSTQPAFIGGSCHGCVAHSNTAAGFSLAGSKSATHCLSYGNSGASSDGFRGVQDGITMENCAAYNNGRDGFRASVSGGQYYINCIAEANAAFGFNANAIFSIRLLNCATFNNTSGATNLNGLVNESVGLVTGSSSFFVNAAGNDFALNSTAGAGAAARAAGFPGIFPAGATTSYLDIGAAQSQGTPGAAGAGITAQLV